MSKTCVRHKDASAATMCHQCHSPICTACSIVTPGGTYCSPECSILHREVKNRLQEGKPQGMPRLETMIKLIVVFLLAWLGFYGVHRAAVKVPVLRRIDIIGRLQQAFDSADKGRND